MPWTTRPGQGQPFTLASLASGSWRQSEFGDRGALDMAVGPVRGVRWWAMQDDWSLQGAFGGTWVPGENVGACRKRRATKQVMSQTLTIGSTVYTMPKLVRTHIEDPGDHPAADPDCTCGFYAFWEPEPLPVHEQYPVIGVIEGYGRTVLGTRGFRCQKARILGLHFVRYDWGLSFVQELQAEQGRRTASARLGQRYDVPTYPSVSALLATYPPTQDYAELPVEASRAD